MRPSTLALVLSLVGCARPLASPATCPPTAPVAAAPAAPAAAAPAPAAPEAPALDEAALVAASEAFFAAYDRDDAAGFAAATAPEFVSFATARFWDRARLITRLTDRAARHAPPTTRTWLEHRVFLADDVATFVGESIEHLAAEADRPAGDLDNWHTLVWRRVGASWQVSHWQIQRGGLEGERAMWNEVFTTSVGFNHQPNQTLVDAIKGVKPGRALDLATGQGRNALYLAAQGWKTTGVDISDQGLRLADEAARARHLSLVTVNADLEQWDLGRAKWDLITLIYAGDDPKLLDRIAAALRPRGLIVVEFFHKDATAGTGIGGFETGALAARFKDGFEILRDDVVDDTADWGLRTTKLVRFVARKK